MSNKILRPFPQGTGRAFMVDVQRPSSVPPGSLRDVHFLRTWFEYDSEINDLRQQKGVNWYAIFGLLLVIAVSAGFWTGLGLILSRLSK